MTVRLKPDTTAIAIDVAILPPAEVSARAVALSAALPAGESQGLLLGGDCLPHITLTQQFVPSDSLHDVLTHIDRVAGRHRRLRLRIRGGGKGSNSVWMSIERTPELSGLHEQLQQVMDPFEVDNGDAAAFVDADARDRDVRWVREFRRESSFERFTPHITLGHASEPPTIEPFDFLAATIAVCHLGRFCTCRRSIRAWELRGE